MTSKVVMFKVGDHGEVPGPEVYWMSHFDKWIKLSFYIFLIDTNDGYVLVNTGLPKDLKPSNLFLSQWAGSDRCRFTVKEEEKLEYLLKELGLKTDDIAHIIITPVQDYTTGSLDIFSNSKIYFSRTGWYEDVVNPEALPFVIRDLILPPHIREHVFEHIWNRIVLVENQKIVDGVSVKWTGGHHRSSMAVIMKDGDRTIGLTDTAFTRRNLEENIPIGIAENVYECLAAYDYLKRNCDAVIPAYDPENTIRFKQLLLPNLRS